MRRPRLSLPLAAAVVLAMVGAVFSGHPAEARVHECSYCHGVHGAVPGSDTPLGQMLVIEDLCMSCHGPTGPSTRKANVHLSEADSNFGITCLVCHNPHSNEINRLGTDNIMLVRSLIFTARGVDAEVVFTSRGSDSNEPQAQSFCDNQLEISTPSGNVSDSVCDVCHTEPRPGRHHFDATTGHHQSGSTCTRCHTHSNGFVR